ncbi:MAG: flagellar M-ring protein FliF, partial [Actinobacteria bacterium]|nr:flagellar M-ring protein FliF [Actinomycetota bacterium]NIS36184.1 flagellar M-ring protein FliF [Actinomycetota bacterium]NIU66389.1 flagellar M-ring protein FliF [Actinomycetota bacterium]NIW32659.1 flagellar M-ring protein FliF [Actinomycetota bacterium]NIX24852.1 flagellar M-ring protein FliF [Actinomycetota bacterium]
RRTELPAATVRGISNLVAAGVEGLAPEAVVLMDSFGRLLHPNGPTAEDDYSGQHVQRR